LLFPLAAMFCLSSANATVPTIDPPKDCTQYGSGTTWPARAVYFCGSAVTSVEAEDVYNALNSKASTADFIKTTMQSDGGLFLLYENPTSYQEDFPGKLLPDTTDGVTTYSAGVPQYTAIFVADTNSDIGGSDPLANVAMHELGHWLDYLNGTNVGGQVSLVNSFLQATVADWTLINTKPACGTGGLFTGQLDPTKQSHPAICDGDKLASGYSGTNKALIKQFYEPFNNNSELFAESLAVVTGYTDDSNGATVNDPDHFMNSAVSANLFACTKNFVSSEFNTNEPPTTTPKGLTCLAPPLPGCVLINTNETYFPYNVAYYCGTNSEGDQSNIDAFFNALYNSNHGELGTELTALSGNYYLFPTQAAANTALASDGEVMTSTFPSQTFLDSGISVVLETLNSVAVPVANKTGHEIGHWLDRLSAAANTGAGSPPFTSSSKTFTADLNYDVSQFNALGACSANSSGVIIFSGQVDYLGKAICTGSSLSTTYAGLTNYKVVLKAWPVLTLGANDGSAPAGVFAELTTLFLGYPVQVNETDAYQDYYLGNYFSCSKDYINGLTDSGNPSQHVFAPCPIP
jgi:hypothetical protein